MPEIWYAVENDLVGGWCIMNVNKKPSQCDFRQAWNGGDRLVADFMRREDAVEIARVHNWMYKE